MRSLSQHDSVHVVATGLASRIIHVVHRHNIARRTTQSDRVATQVMEEGPPFLGLFLQWLGSLARVTPLYVCGLKL